MHTSSIPRLVLWVPQEAISGFASLFQHGILFTVDRPVSLLPFLLSLPGFTADYIENTVQTLFINGVAADRLDRDLPAGSTLALSAAMPGLAGAIFRRQGVHGSLRTQAKEKDASGQAASGFITLKLFNTIALDRGHDLLTEGILVTGKVFHDFAVKREHLFQSPAHLLFAEHALELSELLRAVAECPVVMVQARLLPEGSTLRRGAAGGEG